ncbi:hypothetical protein I8H83_04645 [Candidatus Saccharibacteria bacterium]|nr:hypothetical protein [Candidatus Saccharibacteria bacterium]MBH2007869.1 hypothetical protein [Candidatus Saccharibacteria bacterium]
MNEIIRPPKQLDLPRNQFDDLANYETYRSDTPGVIAKRQLHPGTLVPDQEYRSISITDALHPTRFESPRDQHAARDIYTRIALGSANYGLRSDETMFSVLKLGLVADGRRTTYAERHYTTPEEYLAQTQRSIALAAMTAEARLQLLRTDGDPERIRVLSRSVGRHLGNAGLQTLAYDMPGKFNHLHPVDIQIKSKELAIELLSDTRSYAQDIGVVPSVAQLAEPDSPVAVDIRRNAPPAVRRAYEAALAANPEEQLVA